jgi:hypothetical protein
MLPLRSRRLRHLRLAFHPGKAGQLRLRGSKGGLRVDPQRLQTYTTRQAFHYLRQGVHRGHRDPLDHRGFGCVFTRHNQAFHPRPRGRQGGRERAPDRFHMAVKEELAKDADCGEHPGGDHSCGAISGKPQHNGSTSACRVSSPARTVEGDGRGQPRTA